MTDVFVSYARVDRDRARILAEELARRGFDVWWDIDLLPGDRFEEEIRAVLERAKAAVVLWSNASVRSDFVRDEANLARQRGILIPARLDDCDLPLSFGVYHTHDLSGWLGQPDDGHLQALANALAVRSGLRPSVPETQPQFKEHLHAADASSCGRRREQALASDHRAARAVC